MAPQPAAGTGTEPGGVLRKSLGRFDLVFLTISAVIGIDTIAQIAGAGGAQAFTWSVVIAIGFLFPYALVMAELGSTFRDEGGPYVWVRLAFGRFPAAVSTLFYWITNPIWLGGSLAFISATTWSTYLHPLAEGSAGDYIFKIVFIWLAIAAAVVGLQYGKWVVNVGAVVKIALVLVFVVTVAVYAVKSGVHGYAAGDFTPTTAGFLGVVPVLLFALVGFEAPSGAAEEMRNPERDVPAAIASSGSVAVACYLVPIFAILAVVPAGEISGAGGFLDAVTTVFSVYGPAAPTLLRIAAGVFILVVLTQGSAWMIASDRVQAVAGADGAFPRWFGVFHPRLGTPLRVNLLSGVVATVFTVAATALVEGDSAAVFQVVLSIAVTTLLLSYLLIFPTAIRLRARHAGIERPYRVPGGRAGLWACTVLIYLWVLLGSWAAVFPGTIERALGVPYDFEETWSVDRPTFEIFTLGTLAAITVIAAAGYLWARRHDQSPQTAPTPVLE
ncbi:APC family permease [Spirillospora sp. NBC_01491]|uniref:APC family permease n=1 Tax=Spirillospora sp. NBC_01491 TaxID=2976007 RepID=UPI002E351F2F|nr:APC family permease [Spirillospora sp. NBC_01491]